MMTSQPLNAEQERELIQKFFGKARQTLQPYFQDRNLELSNAQLFAFVLVSPMTIAIACDGTLDFTETTMLVDIASYFDRDILPTELDVLEQPNPHLSDQDFKKLIFSELRYLCLSMSKYQNLFVQCVREMIQLDEQVSRDQDPRFSIKRRVIDMMQGVIHNNRGHHPNPAEAKKVQAIMQELGIA